MKNKTGIIILLGILLLTLIAPFPVLSEEYSELYSDDFESYDIGDPPDSDYWYLELNGDTINVQANPSGSGQVLKIAESGDSSTTIAYLNLTTDISDLKIEFDLYYSGTDQSAYFKSYDNDNPTIVIRDANYLYGGPNWRDGAAYQDFTPDCNDDAEGQWRHWIFTADDDPSSFTLNVDGSNYEGGNNSIYTDGYDLWLFLMYKGRAGSYFIDNLTVYGLDTESPFIGEFQAPKIVYPDEYFYLNATVRDPQGNTTFQNATIELKNRYYKVKWDNSTNTFSIESDDSVLNLGTNNLRISLNSTSYKLCWNISLTSDFPSGWVNIESEGTAVYDEDGNYRNGSYTNLFLFNPSWNTVSLWLGYLAPPSWRTFDIWTGTLRTGWITFNIWTGRIIVPVKPPAWWTDKIPAFLGIMGLFLMICSPAVFVKVAIKDKDFIKGLFIAVIMVIFGYGFFISWLYSVGL